MKFQLSTVFMKCGTKARSRQRIRADERGIIAANGFACQKCDRLHSSSIPRQDGTFYFTFSRRVE